MYKKVVDILLFWRYRYFVATFVPESCYRYIFCDSLKGFSATSLRRRDMIRYRTESFGMNLGTIATNNTDFQTQWLEQSIDFGEKV